MKKPLSLFAGVACLVAAAMPATAQSNAVPGIDVELGLLDAGTDLQYWGRVGAFPNGSNGLSMSTTSCNAGSINVPWFAPMSSNHPLIAFMAVRVDNGRIEQISDRSWLKHGFFALSNSQCYPCQNPSGGTFLGVGCSDTYGVGNNGDRFYLGPPDEIDPWLGIWNPSCSFFDDPNDTGICDSQRSYNGNEPNSVNHRMTIRDADLDVPGAKFYYYGYYVIRSEPENVRGNNGNSREFRPNWTGAAWQVPTTGFSNPHVQGTVLQRWPGATITSGMNDVNNPGTPDDGRVYIGLTVTDNGNGTWHYEYALHNRDNDRGIAAFRLPTDAGTVVTNPSFRDIDQVANDWTFSNNGSEIAWTTANNPLRWNTIYNFSFDANTPGAASSATLDQFDPGTGANAFPVSVTAPLGGTSTTVTYCQGKQNSLGCVPFITFSGQPSVSATAPFQVRANDMIPGEIALISYGLNGRSNLGFHNGTLCVKAPLQRLLPAKVANNNGTPPCSGIININFNNRIQSGNDPLLTVGQQVNAQYRGRDAALGDGFGDSLTDGIEFIVGP